MSDVFALQLNELEIKTREIMNQMLRKKHTPLRLMLATTFVIEYAHSMPVQRIANLLMVRFQFGVANYDENLKMIQLELQRLVKAKVLRRRRVQGVTVFEVNY